MGMSEGIMFSALAGGLKSKLYVFRNESTAKEKKLEVELFCWLLAWSTIQIASFLWERGFGGVAK